MSNDIERDFYKDLGEKLLGMRSSAGMKRAELAKSLGINAPLLAYIENKGKKVSVFRLSQILDRLGYELQFVKKNAPILLSK